MNKNTIQTSVETIERSCESMRKSADEMDRRGENSSELRAKISYYDEQAKKYRSYLKSINWLTF